MRNLLFALFILSVVGCAAMVNIDRVKRELTSMLNLCDVNTIRSVRNDDGDKRTMTITCTVEK